MNINEIFVAVCILLFYHLFNEFKNSGGMNFNLLKLIMEMIILLFMMILMKYKEEIKEVIHYDKCHQKLDDFLIRNGK